MLVLIWIACMAIFAVPVFLFAFFMSHEKKDHIDLKKDFELWAFNGPLEGRDKKELIRKFWNERHPKHPVFVTDHLEDAIGMMVALYAQEKGLTKSQVAKIKKKMYR